MSEAQSDLQGPDNVTVAAFVGSLCLLVTASVSTMLFASSFSYGFTDGDVPPLADQLLVAAFIVAALGFLASMCLTGLISGGRWWVPIAAAAAGGVIVVGLLRGEVGPFEPGHTWTAVYFAASGLALRWTSGAALGVRLVGSAIVVPLILIPSSDILLLWLLVLPFPFAFHGLGEALGSWLSRQAGPVQSTL